MTGWDGASGNGIDVAPRHSKESDSIERDKKRWDGTNSIRRKGTRQQEISWGEAGQNKIL